jgi:hypothetical protein
VVLCVRASGQKCKPMVIFKRKTMPKVTFPPGIFSSNFSTLFLGIIVKVNERGWMNEFVMEQWVDEVWMQRRNPGDAAHSVLILDAARSHLTDLAKDAVRDSAKMVVVPGGLTKKLQPLDISVNRSFKVSLFLNFF